MSRESWKVFVACALGAGTGSLVALEVSHWFWWIGLIAGGLIGYLAYEFREVLLAISATWKAIVHPSPQLRLFEWKVILWLSLSFSAILPIFLILWSIVDIENTGLATFISMTLTLGFILGFAPIPDITMWYINGKTVEDQIIQLRKVNYMVFPPRVIFWHLPRGIVWLVRATSKILARFCWQVFIRIHSEMRLLCMADAALGAAVGYWAGSAVIGAISGGVFGLVNYAVVTKRILEPRGLLPAR